MEGNEKKKVSFLFIISLIIVALIIIILVVLSNNGDNSEQDVISSGQEDIAESQNGSLNLVEKYVDVLEDGTKINISEKLKEDKKFEGLTIKNTQLTYSQEKTELTSDIENTSGTDKDAMLVDIVFYDEQKNEIAIIAGRISPVKKGQTIKFSTSAMIDYANIYDFEFKTK